MSILNDLKSELEHLEKAKSLLEEIWYSMESPYSSTIQLEDKLRWKLQDFFGFDDSE